MNRLPQKTSLVTQTASVILEEIAAGRWADLLPGEHQLCAQYLVSRRTVRAALQHLSRVGAIKCRHGQRREIVNRSVAGRKAVNKRVVSLTPGPLQSLNPWVVILMHRLSERLRKEGYALEMHSSRVPYRSRLPQGLENLVKTLHPAGWVLLYSTETMQRWFATRQLPCVVVGSCYGAIKLPSIDQDYASVCQHAVNKFVSRGHRRLVLLNPPDAAGDVVAAEGFRLAAAKAGVQGSVQHHDGSVAGICALVDKLTSSAPPPTAFLVSRARHCLTVLSHLLHTGVRVPDDIALISRDDDSLLEDVVPSVARYSNNRSTFASTVSRAVLEMLHGDGRIKSHKIMPVYIHGKTLS